jgi:predicted nuclease of predicted toxin-antitoxin system
VKVLLDACVWGGAKAVRVEGGHDVVSVVDRWQRDPGDGEIIALANAERRVLVTLDKDFGELAIVRGALHAGIVRLAGLAAREQGLAAREVLAAHGEALTAGAIVTVERDRVRVRDER